MFLRNAANYLPLYTPGHQYKIFLTLAAQSGYHPTLNFTTLTKLGDLHNAVYKNNK